jgi:sugar O-acyltransferase (sialic acid O-acetyltransferase NeuD family)
VIIIGAGGHSKEVLGIFSELGETGNLFFYDDASLGAPDLIFDQFPILKTKEAARTVLLKDSRFVLGVGGPSVRKQMEQKFTELGGSLTSIISPYARIGNFNVLLGAGLNIMTGSVITQDVIIGKGTIVHINATVHHDCRIGEFCELSPGCHILGKVCIGDLTSVGAGAVILPGIKVGSNVAIGAGAVVTRNIGDGSKVKGMPAC